MPDVAWYFTKSNAREGELLVESAAGKPVVRSRVISGLFVRREWLDPGHLPKVLAACSEIGRA